MLNLQSKVQKVSHHTTAAKETGGNSGRKTRASPNDVRSKLAMPAMSSAIIQYSCQIPALNKDRLLMFATTVA